MVVPGTCFTDIRHVQTVGSTSAEVAAAAAGGAPAGLVVVADHQEAGRGRLGRSWIAPAATNLLVSVLLRPALAWDEVHRCSTAVCLAAAVACRDVAGLAVCGKWPNDLVVGDRKLAGVLAEAQAGPPGQPGPAALVVGLGLNVAWPGPHDVLPAGMPAAVTSIWAETGRKVSRPALLTRFLEDLHDRLADLASPEGWRRQAGEYRTRCATLGQQVVVTLPGETLRGVAEDVTDSGALVVFDGTSDRVVTAGDVVHVRPASSGPTTGGGGS